MSTAKTDHPAKPATPSRSKAAKAAPQPRVTPVEVVAEEALAPGVAKASAAKSKPSKAMEARSTLARKASVMLKFVSDPTRLQVILFLADDEHHVGALCEQLGQSQPAVSHHLALLRHGGIILPRRQGKNNFYSLSNTGAELAKVLKLLLQTA